MPASLLEAYGDNYQSYPPPDDENRKKKKSNKHKKYGKEEPKVRFTHPEPNREINIEVGGYQDMDDQFLEINANEYGPTDYNIKPKNVQEYAQQMNNNYYNEPQQPRNLSRNIGTNVIDTNLIEEEDQDNTPEDNITPSTTQTSTPTPSSNPELEEFNRKLDMILEKLGHFDEPTQENIHDIILFVIFGCFVIFILDSIYRVGKMTL
jgi:hypothetical protein